MIDSPFLVLRIDTLMPSTIQESVPVLCRAVPASRATDTAVLSWVADNELYLLAGPIQSRSADEIAVHLISAAPLGQIVRVDLTEGQPHWAVIRLCTPTEHAYTVRVQLQNRV